MEMVISNFGCMSNTAYQMKPLEPDLAVRILIQYPEILPRVMERREGRKDTYDLQVAWAIVDDDLPCLVSRTPLGREAPTQFFTCVPID